MKTLKTSIIVAALTISSLTIAQAQETKRKGWDGSIKVKKTETNIEPVSETPTTLDHAINTKGAGANDRKKNPDLTKNDATSTSSEKLANNKHPDLMKRQSEPVSETPTTLDHAINTKGAGAQDRKKNPDLTKNDASSTSSEKLANNKHPDLMKLQSEAVSETPTTLDHAINTKGAGAERKKNPDLTKNDATSTSSEKTANNKHPDLMK